jgi:hypothetical protein
VLQQTRGADVRWEDEPYVKLYNRDTPTWKAMCWQAKGLLPLLMRKVDKAGLMECGEVGRIGVSLMVDCPVEYVEAGLAGLEKLGVAVWHAKTNTLELPKYEEAQEARKSDILRKREERQRAKDKLHAQAKEITQVVSHDVTRRPEVSESVTLRQLSSAQPSPDKKPAGKNRPPESIPESPSWQALVDACFAVFKALRGVDPNPSGKDWKRLKDLRKRTRNDDAEIVRRLERGLEAQFKQRCDSFTDLFEKWDSLTGAEPPTRAANGRASNEAKDWTRPIATTAEGEVLF